MAPILRTVLENFVLRKTEWSKPDGKVVLLTGAYGTLAPYRVCVDGIIRIYFSSYYWQIFC